MAIGKLFVDFEARTATFEEKTKRARRSMGDFGKSAHGAGGQMTLMRGMVTRLLPAIGALSIATAGLSSTFNNIRIKEKLDAQLKVATGSAENAKIAFADLSVTAGKMPNQLQEITQEFIRLRNLGLKAGERELLAYGNTAAAMGKSLNQMIEAVADATTGEFERLKEFGIKSRQQGDKVTFTFRGVSTTVKKSAEDIENYLKRIGEVEFAGSMAEQMDTIDGKLSQLGDSWFQFTTRVKGKAWVKEGIQALTDGLNSLTDGDVVKEIAKKVYGDPKSLGISDLPALRTLFDEELARSRQFSGDDKYYEKNEKLAKDALNNAYNVVEPLILQLEKEKELKAAKEETAAVAERSAAGAKALDAWETKTRRAQMGILKTYGEDSRKILNQISELQVKIRQGAAGNVDAAIKELETLQKQQEKLAESYQKAKKEQDDAATSMTRYMGEWKNMRLTMRETFAEGIAGGRKLGEVLDDVLAQWARAMVMNMALGKLNPDTGRRDGGFLDGIFGGSDGTGGVLGWAGDIFGGIFGGGRASGGGVSAGQLYRVNEGEGRREYFKPNMGGQVIPLGGATGGGGVVINMNVDARGADNGVAARLMVQLPSLIKTHALAAVQNEQRRRGM